MRGGRVEPVPRRLFAFWFGPGMNATRAESLASLGAAGVPVVLVTENTLDEWIIDGQPFHPAWINLSAIHKGDYVRAYFMHHHGGGYSDIKPTSESWLEAFREFDDPTVLAVGYPEIGRHGVAQFDLDFTGGRYQPWRLTWWQCRWLQMSYRSLIGNGAYICRPNSPFTKKWLDRANARLDSVEIALSEHPEPDPRERRGHVYGDRVSSYPLTWAGLHGDIFHPLAYRYRRRIRRVLPAPSFVSYQ